MDLYEIEFEMANPLYPSEKFKTDYVFADSSDEAQQKIRWIHGELIDITNVERAVV